MADDAVTRRFQEELNLLRREYVQKLPGKIREIEAAWNELLQGPWDGTTFRTLHRRTHSMAGSGAMFGFTSLGDAAHALELFVKTILESGNPPTPEQRAHISMLLDLLKQASAATVTEHYHGG